MPSVLCVMVVDISYEDKTMRTRNLLITALIMLGILSPLSTAQVVINMPPPAPKATHVKVKTQPTSTASASISTNSTSSTQSQVREGDIAIRRYVRSRSGPKYTSGMYDYRGYGYGYSYGYYGYYSPYFYGFGWGLHHHHHSGQKSDPK